MALCYAKYNLVKSGQYNTVGSPAIQVWCLPWAFQWFSKLLLISSHPGVMVAGVVVLLTSLWLQQSSSEMPLLFASDEL